MLLLRVQLLVTQLRVSELYTICCMLTNKRLCVYFCMIFSFRIANSDLMNTAARGAAAGGTVGGAGVPPWLHDIFLG
jgi:hypothetical protein